MNPPAPFFEFYAAEFVNSRRVRLMSLEERGLYISMLCVEWMDGPIPDDVVTVARLVGVMPKQVGSIYDKVKLAFESTAQGLINRRLEDLRNCEIERKHVLAARAKAGAAARWGGGASKSDEAQSESMPKHDESNASRAGAQLLSSSSQKRLKIQGKPDSTGKTKQKSGDPVAALLQDPEFRELAAHPEFERAWRENEALRREKGWKRHAPTTVRARFRKALKVGVDLYVEAIEYATENGYQGVDPEWLSKSKPRVTPAAKDPGAAYLASRAKGEAHGDSRGSSAGPDEARGGVPVRQNRRRVWPRA